jgi:50S ribosomal subunit-associated GTPase HflX
VVDAGDDARDEHMDTTEKVLAELELDAIPRIVVFNKSDTLAPFARKLLQKKFPDSVVLSAKDRETTRPLLVKLARALAERWEHSAKMPEAPPTEPLLPDDEDHLAGAADEGATLEDLLRITGRRVKRTPAPTPPAAAKAGVRTDKVQ